MRLTFISLLRLWFINFIFADNSSPWNQTRRTFKATEHGFELDGKKFNVYAGEIHYFRIAPCWWQDRLRKLKSAGFNTVSTAIEWAMHEPKPKKYRWLESANFIQFIDYAFQLELFVIIRAGPFIDADRELGGLPKWLYSKYLNINRQIRSNGNTAYHFHVQNWLNQLLPKLAPRTITNGGPIIMFQIDSDLGEDPLCGQTDWLYKIFASHLGGETVFFTMNDNFHQSLKCGHINGTVAGFRTDPVTYVSFNTSISNLFASFSELHPSSPKLIELRCGTAWFWGGKRNSYDPRVLEEIFTDLVSFGCSIILYMFAGGTNFERAGCSSSQPTRMLTSYDYDAPVSETGELTKQYFWFRSLFISSPYVQESTKNRTLYSRLNFTYVGSLLDPKTRKDLGIVPKHQRNLMMFHELEPSTDMVLYETNVPTSATNRTLLIHSLGIHDRGYVYIGRNYVGIMNRTHHAITLKIPPGRGQSLQILVESLGYQMHPIFTDRKGITDKVYLGKTVLTNWTMYAVSFEDISWKKIAGIQLQKIQRSPTMIFRATFVSKKKLLDSVLDVRTLRKGKVFLNKIPLGEIWPQVGPQQYLYVPGCFLRARPYVNEVIVIEFQNAKSKKSKKSRTKTNSSSPHHCSTSSLYFLLVLYLFLFTRLD